MARDDLSIEVGITVDKLARQLAKTEARMQKTAQKMERDFAKANNQVASSFGGMSRSAQADFDKMSRSANRLKHMLIAAFSTHEIMQFADAWTTAANKIASSAQISGIDPRSLSEVNDIARETRSSLASTADLYAKLLRSTADLAVSEQDVAKATEISNKAFKAGGAAISEQNAAIMQLAQGLGSGVLQGDELRSIRENAPLLAKAIADEFGVSVAELKKLGEEGQLTSERVFRAILNSETEIEAAFKTTNATIGESFTILRNQITEYVGSADDSLEITKKIAAALDFLADNLDLVVAAGLVLGSRVLAPIMIAAMTRASVAARTLSASLVGLSAGAKVTAASLGLLRGGLALLGGPLGLALTALTVLPMLMKDNDEKLVDYASAVDGASAALDDFIAASKKAEEEQAKLGGVVSSTTKSMLDQSRAQLQLALSDLKEELASLKSDLNGDFFKTGELRLSSGDLLKESGLQGGNNFLRDISTSFMDLRNQGVGDVSAIAEAMQRLAGVGEEVVAPIEAFRAALSEGNTAGIQAYGDELLALAEKLGLFKQEIDAVNSAPNFEAKAQALQSLSDRMLEASQAGAVLRKSEQQDVMQLLSMFAQTESEINQMESALSEAGDATHALTDDSEDLAQSQEQAAKRAGELSATIGKIDFTAAVGGAAALAEQLGISLQQAAQLLGLLNQTQEKTIFDPRDPHYDAEAAKLESLKAMQEEILEGAQRRMSTLPDLSAPSKGIGGGGGGGAQAAGYNSAADALERLNAMGQDRINQINLELDLMSAAPPEVARRRFEEEALNRAKQEGLDLDAVANAQGQTLRQVFAAQAEEVGRLTGELERQQQVQDQLNNISQAFADGIVDSIVASKNLGETFRRIASQILADMAKMILRQQMLNALKAAFGEGGAGGGGVLGTIRKFMGFAEGGPVRAATGGYIRGAGTSTSDSIPALLSNGEYVINAEQTKRFLPILAAINEGRVPRFADGGLVGARGARAPALAGGGGFNATITINNTGDGNLDAKAARQVDQMITNRVYQVFNKEMRGGGAIAR